MLKKEISYVDYNDQPRKEDFYFNLSKAEILEMEMGTPGGFAAYVQKIVAAQDAPTIFKVFKEIILKSYGEKSLDGKRFMKSEEISTAFSQTEAFSELLTLLATNSEEGAAFVNGIIPKTEEAPAPANTGTIPYPAKR